MHQLDPLGDAQALKEQGAKKNFAKVGASRPSTLLYTYGPGAIMDLPNFTVMPGALSDWDRVYARRDGPPLRIHAPRLLDAINIADARMYKNKKERYANEFRPPN